MTSVLRTISNTSRGKRPRQAFSFFTRKMSKSSDGLESPLAARSSNEAVKVSPHTRTFDSEKDILSFSKSASFRRWYREVTIRGGMIKEHDVPGCFIMCPTSMFIWETIQSHINTQLRQLGVKPCYFPLFVSDQPHPSEVSSATFLPGKVTSAGESTLNEPVALRESGNSVAWKCLSEWIRSHRDLPMKVHYWGSSIRFNSRWRHIPFLKCREVLQQEGFAVHRSLDESAEFCDALSKIYRRACEDLLALPSREAYDGEQRFLEVPMLNNDQRIRFLTISCNGVDDSLPYEDSDGHRKPAHVVTWRMDFSIIGAMVMVHGDNRGLSIPPSVSEIQVVVIPIPPPRGIGSALFEERMKAIEQRCEELVTLLNERSIRCIIDDDPKKRPGFKLTRWNLRGVPLIIQIGWKEVETNTITVVRRHNNEKLHNEPSNADTICRHLSRVNDEMLLSARQST